jgi:hypothetical protein
LLCWIDTLYVEDGCDCRSTDVLGFAVDERLGVHIATRASIASFDRAVVQQSLRQTGHDEIEVAGGWDYGPGVLAVEFVGDGR